LTGLALVVVAPTAQADILGFNNGVGWTANNNGSGPTFTATTLTITDGGFFELRSAYNNTPQSITQFNASFTYQATSPGGIGLADGTTFILQNQGLNALGLGNDGSGLGVNGISPSAEVELNVYAGHTIGTNFEINGANSQNYMSTSPVDLASGDPILVNLSYNGTTLTERLTDTVTSATFSTSYSVNLASVLGGSTALVGFTGSTGAGTSVQTVSNFSYLTAVPEPASLVLMGIGVSAMTVWQRRRRTAA
jgi:hypothetical protein